MKPEGNNQTFWKLMRAFIALNLPKSVKNQLIRALAPLQSKLKKDIRWTAAVNLHLTLRFLGDTSPEQAAQLMAGLDDLAQLPPAHMTITNYGAFSSWKSPSTIWLGFEPHDTLTSLQQHIETLAQECAFTAEKKPFRPHLTIARLRRGTPESSLVPIRETFQKQSVPPIAPFAACDVVLFQSILRPEGAVYEPLHCINLQK